MDTLIYFIALIRFSPHPPEFPSLLRELLGRGGGSRNRESDGKKIQERSPPRVLVPPGWAGSDGQISLYHRENGIKAGERSPSTDNSSDAE